MEFGGFSSVDAEECRQVFDEFVGYFGPVSVYAEDNEFGDGLSGPALKDWVDLGLYIRVRLLASGVHGDYLDGIHDSLDNGIEFIPKIAKPENCTGSSTRNPPLMNPLSFFKLIYRMLQRVPRFLK